MGTYILRGEQKTTETGETRYFYAVWGDGNEKERNAGEGRE